MNKPILCMLFLLGAAYTAFAKTYTVHNPAEFTAAAGKAAPGDVISIANGTYTDWAVEANLTGTAAKPVIIKAESEGKVIFTGNVTEPVFKLTGKYTTLSGITFTGCMLSKSPKQVGVLVRLTNTNSCRVTQCTFTKNEVAEQFTPLVIVSGTGHDNRVDHCNFISNVNNQELQVKVTKEDYPVNTLIDHNLFKDKAKVTWKVFNGGECVQIGQDPVLLGIAEPKTLVRDNQFIRCNGEPEVISNKSSGNRYIHNSFEDCEGELVMRGGHDCLIDSNTIIGGIGGIRVNGTGHTITHNHISNVKTGIRLMYGMAKGKNEIGFYVAAGDCTIKNNIIENTATGILVGDSKGADWTGKFDTKRYPSRVMQDVAPYDNRISDNVFKQTTTEMVTN